MTSIDLKTKHINETVVVRKATYPNGSTALVLSSPIGEPKGHATVALEELPGTGNVFIKDWNENAGLLGALQQLGIVGQVIRTVPAGFCEAHEVELLTEIDSWPTVAGMRSVRGDVRAELLRGVWLRTATHRFGELIPCLTPCE